MCVCVYLYAWKTMLCRNKLKIDYIYLGAWILPTCYSLYLFSNVCLKGCWK